MIDIQSSYLLGVLFIHAFKTDTLARRIQLLVECSYRVSQKYVPLITGDITFDRNYTSA